MKKKLHAIKQIYFVKPMKFSNNSVSWIFRIFPESKITYVVATTVKYVVFVLEVLCRLLATMFILIFAYVELKNSLTIFSFVYLSRQGWSIGSVEVISPCINIFSEIIIIKMLFTLYVGGIYLILKAASK